MIGLEMIGRDVLFQRKLLAWYHANRRDLPWRQPGVTPYHILVSEAMLQQTQVATVIPYFDRFIRHFPTVHDLASADEQQVLRLWQGLGYYSRARNLRYAAQQIVADFSGVVPRTVDELMTLRGVGRYTAGAIASIAYDVPAPILDGNVMRVLCRVDRIEADPRDRPTQQHLWQRAEQILPRRAAGDFNSALMELGATVCTPRAPACGVCPVRTHCQARADGMQAAIPPARKAAPTPIRCRQVFVIEHHGRFLMQQRPAGGRWAGMWQFITLESDPAAPDAVDDARVAARAGVRVCQTQRLGEVKHALTHRRYTFEVYRCRATSGRIRSNSDDLVPTWMTTEQIDQVPLPRPHLKIAGLAGILPPATPSRGRGGGVGTGSATATGAHRE